jgi:hypothetical protein
MIAEKSAKYEMQRNEIFEAKLERRVRGLKQELASLKASVGDIGT